MPPPLPILGESDRKERLFLILLPQNWGRGASSTLQEFPMLTANEYVDSAREQRKTA